MTIISTFFIPKMMVAILLTSLILKHVQHSEKHLMKHCVKSKRPNRCGLGLLKQKENQFHYLNIARLFTRHYLLNEIKGTDKIKKPNQGIERDWVMLDGKERSISTSLQKNLLNVILLIIPLIKSSLLLNEADERNIGVCAKKV